MPEIKHLVVLMLENRSFDHMLGWLQGPNYQIDGLDGSQFNLDSTNARVPATRNASYSGDYDPDVAHDFLDVNEQIFGAQNIPPGVQPLMSGFVKNYGAVSQSVSKSHRVMNCFDPAKIPVLTTLAQQYALCTRWFSSVPGPTLPNRAYAHGATSVGHVDMTINWWKETKTIYELLVDHQRTAKIYYTDSTIAITYGGMVDRQSEFFIPDFNAFFDDCKNDNLPDYCFLEPRYNASTEGDPMAASDQHPDHDVAEGETLIHDVYNAIRGNRATWESTLLVILYDEHGGLFDHIPPPAAVSPDSFKSIDPPFAFDRLGVRVPAVLVSPWIEAGTIIPDVFDHASLAATARKLFLGADWKNTFLTQRDKAANTFEGALTRTTARSASEVEISAKHKAAISGRVLSMTDRAIDQAARPLTEHQQALTQVMISAAMANMSNMTQAQAAALHEQLKDMIHGAPAVRGAGL
jgi:phospholipase C